MTKDLKKYIISFIIATLIFIISLVLTIKYYNKLYTRNINGSLVTILDKINENNHINEEEIIEILNSKNEYSSEFLLKYGIDDENSEIILQNVNIKNREYLFITVLGVVYLIILLVIIIIKHRNEEKN